MEERVVGGGGAGAPEELVRELVAQGEEELLVEGLSAVLAKLHDARARAAGLAGGQLRRTAQADGKARRRRGLGGGSAPVAFELEPGGAGLALDGGRGLEAGIEGELRGGGSRHGRDEEDEREGEACEVRGLLIRTRRVGFGTGDRPSQARATNNAKSTVVVRAVWEGRGRARGARAASPSPSLARRF